MPPPAYVDNRPCLGCHQAETDAWLPSHHAKAMAVADAQTVRGNFDGTSFKHKGVTTRFFKRDGKFFVNTEGPDGKLADFEIKYTFGYEPLQQYLIETTDGRLQPLTIAWDTRSKRWFHLFPNEITPPGDVLHWTGRYQTANTMCISCHTTGFDKRYDAAADRFDSHWAEVNVSCQSCHGPGQRHVDWAHEKADGKTPPTLPNLANRRHAGHVAATSGAGLHRLPFAPRRTDRGGGAGRSATRPLPAQPAARRPVPRRRPAARRGLRRWLVPAEQDVPARRDLPELPRRAQRQDQAARQCAVPAVPQHAGQPGLSASGRQLQLALAPSPPARQRPAHSAPPATCRRRTTCRSRRGPTTACAFRGPT